MKPREAVVPLATVNDGFGKARPSKEEVSDETPPPMASPLATLPTPPALFPSSAVGIRRSTERKTIVIVGAENSPALGLARAILEDPKGEFGARAIVLSTDSPESRLLATLGCDVRQGDPRDEAGLKKALAGAYGAFYILFSSEHSSVETRFTVAAALARAANEQGLRHVIWATLEDPGQTLLEHNDVTPTFKDGRWISDRESAENTNQAFISLAVPTTFLQTIWEPSVSAGSWTENIGRHAFGLLSRRESVGQTVSISAAHLLLTSTQALAEAPAVAASAGAAPRLDAVPGSRDAPTRSRRLAMAGMAAAAALVALLIVRPFEGRQRTDVKAVSAPVATLRGASPVMGIEPFRVREPALPEPVAAPESGVGKAPIVTPIHPMGPIGAVAAKRLVTPPARPRRREPVKRATAATPPSGASSPAEQPPVVQAEPPSPRREAPAPKEAAPRAPTAPAVAARVTPTPPPEAPPRVLREPGFVDPKAVSGVVRAHSTEARECYERAIMERPDLRGRLSLRATIDPMGRVLVLSPTSTIEGGARLQGCLVAAFKSWVFPRPVGGVNGMAAYSFSFEPEGSR